ncbi:hypothetical protein OH799_13980 [Nocardia sp. NBC_00881]|uniref:hypothetical protein n=1 Tax=Nocardia sp. NBC_00881 TaxID=2975995 RepID=UPI0038704B76|nr:hypothetical protein OH799_13980 [Nocardia sp. NBC_00881]
MEAAVADAMAPFEIDYTRGEELDIWDAWRITGGTVHGGGFNVLPGHERDSRLIHEFPSRWLTNSTTTPNDFGWCAGGPRELLDFSASREEAAELADAAWRQWRELAAELPAPRPWEFYYARQQVDPGAYSTEQASADYYGQPLARAFKDYLQTLPIKRYSFWFFSSDPLINVGSVGREEFVASEVEGALRRRNLLSLEGWWYEDGSPGIHGACDSTADCPHEPELPAGYDRIDRYLTALPGDTLLVNVRCHV